MFEFVPESHASRAERRWQSWLFRAEDMLGRPMAGEDILAAHDAFNDGACVVEFVLDEKAREVA